MNSFPLYDVVIIGSGLGASIMANRLGRSGASVLILERGEWLSFGATPHEIFVQQKYLANEMWGEKGSTPFRPYTYYNVGGNTKFFGAVMARFREKDFEATEQFGGLSPEWPFRYEVIEPYYTEAERIFRVMGQEGEDPTEPWRSSPFPLAKNKDEPSILAARQRLEKTGLSTFTTPLCVDIRKWSEASPDGTWESVPNRDPAKADAENCFLADALQLPNVTLVTGATVRRLLLDESGKSIRAVEFLHNGTAETVQAKQFVLAAGAVNSAAILLRSADGKAPHGVANKSGQVGRNLMVHHCTAIVAVDPFTRNDAIYQKTISSNDYYFADVAAPRGAGHLQALGKITPIKIRAFAKWAPEFALRLLSSRSIDWFAVSEDLPTPESGILVDGMSITLEWRRPNETLHKRFVSTVSQHLREAGYPIILTSVRDTRNPTHQCGTVRMGWDPASAPLDEYCQSFDHPNLWVVDGSFLPSSTATNPALTIAAQALRSADRFLQLAK
ncbi:GMC family oxidoreductase [Bosea sp. F3-2]|uniref:GMC family oxidoreductase N-terminal domain-containing protein n=1 Tax=Bosea sp. F3-2 TaxID=2599640 RepID=UPI0011EED134|nr:GMC family oxidoreductase [Bosea sp. F3-2]QEL22914.1 GMC family oxidoreductase [Bosea sp. F3-2]